jgi:hypothetical protein
MADVFDKKQEVLKVELTSQGRKLLAQGLFRPQYYAFFDDVVIYDQSYDNATTEQTNDIQNRILNEAVSLSAMNLLEDIELQPLGNSSLFVDYAPAWDLSLLNGTFDMINSASFYKKEFTFNNIVYTIEAKNNNDTNLRNQNFSSYNINDEKYLEVKDDYILLDISEINVSDDNDNFTIEIITYDELAGKRAGGLERKLNFYQKFNNVIDGIIYDDDELPSKTMEITLSEQDVEYYLDILVDDEIDANILNPIEATIKRTIEGTYTSTFTGPTKVIC